MKTESITITRRADVSNSSQSSCSTGFSQWWNGKKNEAMTEKGWAKAAWETARERTGMECIEHTDNEITRLRKEYREEMAWMFLGGLLIGAAIIATVFNL
jgi:hypothetical protein